MHHETGLQPIDKVREEFNIVYPVTNFIKKLQMKMWLNHSESRYRNNNSPFTFHNYINHLRKGDYSEQVRLNIINVDDLGGKEKVLEQLQDH